MSEVVNVLYDYDAQDEYELTLREGDKITVISYGSGDGWWEGECNGKSGLFPANYVQQDADAAAADADTVNDGENYDQGELPAEEENMDDDFSSSEEDDLPPPPEGVVPASAIRSQSRPSSIISRPSIGLRNNNVAQSLGKTIYRYSNYVKTGAEDYLLGNVAVVDTQGEVLVCIESETGAHWEPIANPYTVSIVIGDKKSKYHGTKNYLDYQVVLSDTGSQINHRYKHFEWLHTQLTRKYKFIAIPDLPSKGGFGGVDVEKRREGLENWVNRLCKHPVLAPSPALQFFLRHQGDDKSWKKGKRDTENTKNIGPSLFTCVQPVKSLDVVDSNVRGFKDFCSKHKQSLAKVTSSCESITANSSSVRSQQGRYAEAFLEMAKGDDASMVCCWRPGCQDDKHLTKALLLASQTYEWIGKTIHENSAEHISSVENYAREYQSLVPGYDVITDIQSDCAGKTHEVARLVAQGKVELNVSNQVAERCNVVSSIAESEMNYFHENRRPDMKQASQELLRKEIAMYKNIVERLEKSLKEFENA